jgi:hypothetical protein
MRSRKTTSRLNGMPEVRDNDAALSVLKSGGVQSAACIDASRRCFPDSACALSQCKDFKYSHSMAVK